MKINRIAKWASVMAVAGLVFSPMITASAVSAATEFKIVGVGDSIMRGHGVKEEETFLSLGKSTLQSQFGSKVKVSAVNHAINGTDSDAILYNPSLHVGDLPSEYLKPNGAVNIAGVDEYKNPIITSTTSGQPLDNKFYGQLYRRDVAKDIKEAKVVLVNIGGNDGLLKIVDKLLKDLQVTYEGKKMPAKEAISHKIQVHVAGLLSSDDPAKRAEGEKAQAALAAVANQYGYDDVWAAGIMAELDLNFFELFKDSKLDIMKIKFGEDQAMISAMKASLEKFKNENWEHIIQRIHEINPDANIVAYTSFNPYGAIKKVMKLLGSDLGEVAALIGEAVNPKVVSYAKPGRYYAVDVSKTLDSILGLVLTDSMGADPHLNTKGHIAVNLLTADFYKKLKVDNSIRPCGVRGDVVLENKTEAPSGDSTPATPPATPGTDQPGNPPVVNPPSDGSTPPATDTSSGENRLRMVRINGVDIPGFNPDTYQYQVTVSSDVNRITVDADLLSSAAKFGLLHGPKNYSLIFGSADVTLKVIAANGRVATYKVNVVRGQSASGGGESMPAEDLTLKSLDVDRQPIVLQPNVYDYRIEVKKILRRVNVTAVSGSDYADIVVSGHRRMNKGENLVTVTVTGSNGDMLTYRIIVVLL